jgi:16S rRNA (adenine1518-N6/adenine1519-N6)-dimethyltransferase
MTRLRHDFITASAGSFSRREGRHGALADDKSISPRIDAGFPAKADEREMTSPSRLLKAWKIYPRKSMGQHFLKDPGVAGMIVTGGRFGTEDVVVEIGAGLGALTIPLAAVTRHVLATEPDKKIAALLKHELLAARVPNVTVVEKDFLQCDLEVLAGTFPEAPLQVIGNLPYHISSQILLRLISFRTIVAGALLMFQKEVADRLLAEAGTKAYGRLSVLTQYCADIENVTSVKASSFYPMPKVDSTVVKITFFNAPPFPATDESFLFEVVRAAFGKRRKTLRNALTKSSLKLSEVQIVTALEAAAIYPARRAETLTVKEFVSLAEALRP